MNTLTLNRILQEGDEYLNGNNGAWTKVPKNDFGLQIQFSTYKKTQVRRPSEAPIKLAPSEKLAEGFNGRLQVAVPISQKQQGVRSDQAAEAEKVNAPVPTPSGTGDTPCDEIPLTRAQIEYEDNEAMRRLASARDREIIDKIPAHLPMTDEEQAALDREIARQPKLIPAGTPAAEVKSGFSPSNGILKIKFPRGACSEMPIWTGRNGTFHGYGLDAMVLDDRVMLQPIGKRGVGNCTIQFPTSVIPQIIDWLAAQYREKTK